MGTNFYWKDKEAWIQKLQESEGRYMDFFNNDSPEKHIGKRSAAGQYCFKCGKTLCKEGEARVHYTESHWYDKCPKCHKIDNVKTTCSFTWTMKKHKEELLKMSIEGNNKKVVIDEYGNEYTAKEFLDALQNTKIEYVHGTRFL